ncbi:MAG: FadR/GntR family transcriptional regulator [Nocardioidaceae bacterium]
MTARQDPDWQPVERSRADELVVAQIEEQILSGKLRVGDRLPAERDLALRLGVSRAAVREAIRALEAHGVLRSAVGLGPGSGTTVAAMPSAALTRLLRLHVALANFPLDDVVEARVMLERHSIRLACQRASDADCATMGEALEEMDRTDDQQTFNRWDTAFHVAVAEAGRNRLVADMTIAIRDAMHTPILRGLQRLPDWIPLRDELRAQHHGLFEAIRAGSADTAPALVEDHIRFTFRSLPMTED